MSALPNNVRFPSAASEFIHVSSGPYLAVYRGHEAVTVFRVRKLRVFLQLMEHPEVLLCRWYRITNQMGRISARPSSDLVRELQAVVGHRVRCDRIPVSEFGSSPFLRVEVRDVTSNARQRPLSGPNIYSVVDQILGSERP